MSVSKYALKIDNGLKRIDQLALFSDICTLFPWFGTGNNGSGSDEFAVVLFTYTPVGMHNDWLTFILTQIEYDMSRDIEQGSKRLSIFDDLLFFLSFLQDL